MKEIKKSKKPFRLAAVALSAGFGFAPFLTSCEDKSKNTDLPTSSTESSIDGTETLINEEECREIVSSFVKNARKRYNKIDKWQYKNNEIAEHASFYTDNKDNYFYSKTGEDTSCVNYNNISFIKHSDGKETIETNDETFSFYSMPTDLEDYVFSFKDNTISMKFRYDDNWTHEFKVDDNLQITGMTEYEYNGGIQKYEYQEIDAVEYDSIVAAAQENNSMFEVYKKLEHSLYNSYSSESYVKSQFKELLPGGTITSQNTKMVSQNSAVMQGDLYIGDDRDTTTWQYKIGSEAEAVYRLEHWLKGEFIVDNSLHKDLNLDNIVVQSLAHMKTFDWWEDVSYQEFNSISYDENNRLFTILYENGNRFLINVDEAGNILRLYRDNLNFDWNDYQDEYSDFYKHTCIDFSTSTEAEFTKFLNETQDKIAELKAQIENNEDIENDDVLDV